MNDERVSPQLAEVIAEAKDHLAPGGIDWRRVDEGLSKRLDIEASRSRFSARHAVWPAVAAALSIAAGVVLVMGKPSREPTLEPVAAKPAQSASKVARVSGVLQINGAVSTTDMELAAGDRLEAEGQATFERPGQLLWALERGRAQIARAGAGVVVALEAGAIEADVVPVPQGEALGIDVGSIRVAVHGTHFRVSRQGDRVTVDLNEGTLSIGPAPRAGMTIGHVVTAPAHVTFDASAFEATFSAERDPSQVLPPIDLASGQKPEAALAAQTTPPESDTPAVKRTGRVHRPAPPTPERVPEIPSAAEPSRSPEQRIVSALRGCWAKQARPDSVQITITSSLTLQVSASGSVESAQFEPPLSPDLQTCAADAIYQSKFAAAGIVKIPIELK